MRNKWIRSSAGAAIVVVALQACGHHGAQEGKTGTDENVVDCLVPGQIRQLDEKTTVTTQRQLVRATREECRNRGGEEQPKKNAE
jgi:hypothetical protein